MENMLIYSNLGMGDHIVSNGMVRHFAESSDVTVICKVRNFRSVQAMYSDNPKISVWQVHDDSAAQSLYKSWKHEKLAVGCYNSSWNPKSTTPFDVTFYEQAGIPHTYRWEKCKFSNKDMVEVKDGRYCFVHKDEPRGFKLHAKHLSDLYKGINGKVIVPNFEHCITDWIDVLSRAEEIYCINSAFLILADQIETTGKLYWHQYARNEGPLCNPTVRKQWVILK